MLLELVGTFVLSLVSLYVWLYILRPKIFLRELQRVPLHRGHWLLGTMVDFPKSGDGIWQGMQRRRKQLGLVHEVRLMWMQQVQLYGPEEIKVLAQSNTNISKSAFYGPLLPWLGQSLLLTTGSRWKQKRRLLTPAFHFKILQNYAEVNVEQTSVFLDTLATESRKSEYVDVQQFIPRLTLDIIVRTAFDCTFSAQHGDPTALEYLRNLNALAREYFDTFQNGTALLPWSIYTRFTPGGRQYMWNVAQLHAFTLNVIQQRIEKNKQGVAGKSYQDFLQMLLDSEYEDGTKLTMEDVRAEVDTFMFEGHDTTSSGISWILYCLAAYPDVQEKARKEVLSLIGQRKHVTHDDLGNMSYLTAAVKEALRIYPPVPFISRVLDEGVDIGGYFIPAGTNVSIAPMGVHYNEDIWPEPLKYNPERFLVPEEERSPYAYIPFSAGARNCIGQVFAMNEMKIVAAMVIRRFRLTADAKRKPIIEPAVVLRAENGIHIRFEEVRY